MFSVDFTILENEEFELDFRYILTTYHHKPTALYLKWAQAI